MTSISATEARAALPDLLTRVQGGDEVTITRHGRAVAVLVHPDALRHRRAKATLDTAARIHDLISGAGATSGPGLTNERAEELIREIRAARD